MPQGHTHALVIFPRVMIDYMLEFLLLKPFGSKFQLRSILMTWVFPTSDLMYQFSVSNKYVIEVILAFSLLLVLEEKCLLSLKTIYQ